MTGRELAAGELRELLAEVLTVQGVLRDLVTEIRGTDPGADATPNRATLALLAVDLHSYYTAFEGLLSRVIMTLEGRVPSSSASTSCVARSIRCSRMRMRLMRPFRRQKRFCAASSRRSTAVGPSGSH